jgi:hypothetical protein
MPLPAQFQPAAPTTPARADSGHHFDTAHGDVAALHSRIESSFALSTFVPPPASVIVPRLEAYVAAFSRSAGVVGLAGALAAILYLAV